MLEFGRFGKLKLGKVLPEPVGHNKKRPTLDISELLPCLSNGFQSELQDLKQEFNQAADRAEGLRYWGPFAHAVVDTGITSQDSKKKGLGALKKNWNNLYVQSTPMEVLHLRQKNVKSIQDNPNWRKLLTAQTSQPHIQFSYLTSLAIFELYYLNLMHLNRRFKKMQDEFATIAVPILELLERDLSVDRIIMELKKGEKSDPNYIAYKALLQWLMPLLQQQQKECKGINLLVPDFLQIRGYLEKYKQYLNQTEQELKGLFQRITESMWARYQQGFINEDITNDDVLFDIKAKLAQESESFCKFRDTEVEERVFHVKPHRGMTKLTWVQYHEIFSQKTNPEEQKRLKQFWKTENKKPSVVPLTVVNNDEDVLIVPQGFEKFIPPASELVGGWHPGKSLRRTFFPMQLYDITTLNQKVRRLDAQLKFLDLTDISNLSQIAELIYDIDKLLNILREEARKNKPNFFLGNTFLRETNAMFSAWLEELHAIQREIHAKKISLVNGLVERPSFMQANFEKLTSEEFKLMKSFFKHMQVVGMKTFPTKPQDSQNLAKVRERLSDQELIEVFLCNLSNRKKQFALQYGIDSETGFLIAKIDEAELNERMKYLLSLLTDSRIKKAIQLLFKLITGQYPASEYASNVIEQQLAVLFPKDPAENVIRLLGEIARSYLYPACVPGSNVFFLLQKVDPLSSKTWFNAQRGELDAAFQSIEQLLNEKEPRVLSDKDKLLYQRAVILIKRLPSETKTTDELKEKIRAYICDRYTGSDNRLSFLMLTMGDVELLQLYVVKRLKYLLEQGDYAAVLQEAFFKNVFSILQKDLRSALLEHIKDLPLSITAWDDNLLAIITEFTPKDDDNKIVHYLDTQCYKELQENQEKKQIVKVIMLLVQKYQYPLTKDGAALFIAFLYALDEFPKELHDLLLSMKNKELTQVVICKELEQALSSSTISEEYHWICSSGQLPRIISEFDEETKARIVKLITETLKSDPKKHSLPIFATIEFYLDHILKSNPNIIELRESLTKAKGAFRYHRSYVARLQALQDAFKEGDLSGVVFLLKDSLDCMQRHSEDKTGGEEHAKTFQNAIYQFFLYLREKIIAAGTGKKEDMRTINRFRELYQAISTQNPTFVFPEDGQKEFTNLGKLARLVSGYGQMPNLEWFFVEIKFSYMISSYLAVCWMDLSCADIKTAISGLAELTIDIELFEVLLLLPLERYNQLITNIGVQIKKLDLLDPLRDILQRFKDSLDKKKFDPELPIHFELFKQVLQNIHSGKVNTEIINTIKFTPYGASKYDAFWQAQLNKADAFDSNKAKEFVSKTDKLFNFSDKNSGIEKSEAGVEKFSKLIRNNLVLPENRSKIIEFFMRYYKEKPRLRCYIDKLKKDCFTEVQKGVSDAGTGRLAADQGLISKWLFYLRFITAMQNRREDSISTKELMQCYLDYIKILHQYIKTYWEKSKKTSTFPWNFSMFKLADDGSDLVKKATTVLAKSNNLQKVTAMFLDTWRKVSNPIVGGENEVTDDDLSQMEKEVLDLSRLADEEKMKAQLYGLY